MLVSPRMQIILKRLWSAENYAPCRATPAARSDNHATVIVTNRYRLPCLYYRRGGYFQLPLSPYPLAPLVPGTLIF